MKTKLLRTSVFVIAGSFMAITAFFSANKIWPSSIAVLAKTNVEVLTQNEGAEFVAICRCHNDGECYRGNGISLRPSCAKIIIDAPNADINCSAASGNCH